MELENIPIRLITAKQHPNNLGVFNAASMEEAIIKADKWFRYDQIQGAVWLQDPIPGIEESSLLLKTAYETALEEEEGYGSGYSTSSIQINAQQSKKQTDIKIKDTSLSVDEFLHPTRQEDLKTLSMHFNRIELRIRYVHRERYNLHLDNSPRSAQTAISHKIFQGRDARIIIPRTEAGGGTLIYKIQDHRLAASQGYERYINSITPNKLWQLGTGNALFVKDCRYGKDQALPHTAPWFDFSNSNDIRILDAYECIQQPR